MFMYLQKNKKGFTLIELMVVVAIIAVLALLGLRLYTTQQRRAKEAMVRANAGTVQVAIQTELVDSASVTLDASSLSDLDQLMNPFTNKSGFGSTNAWANVDTQATDEAAAEGMVIVSESNGVYTITPCGEDGTSITYVLTARR